MSKQSHAQLVRSGVEKLFSLLGVELEKGNLLQAIGQIQTNTTAQAPKRLMKLLFEYYDIVRIMDEFSLTKKQRHNINNIVVFVWLVTKTTTNIRTAMVAFSQQSFSQCHAIIAYCWVLAESTQTKL